MKPLIVANWKCNPTTLAEAKQLFNSIAKEVKNIKKVEVVICPPFVYLPILWASAFARRKASYGGPTVAFGVGGQDCFWEEKGAFTGEVSPKMLKDLGCKYVIIGHSERRRNLNETDEMVNRKLKAALKENLRLILCVGNKNRKREKEFKGIRIQMEKALSGIKKSDLKNLIITYEPVWAISTTKGRKIATPIEAKDGAIFIRKILAKLFDKNFAQKIRIIYGGSVDSGNIRGFIKEAKIDGVLVGAASLKSKEFVRTVKAASRA
jgi:triosephosphate isomerase